MHPIKILFLLAIAFILDGCASADKHHHLLTAVDLPINSMADQRHHQQTIAIRQIRLPDYLNEYNIMYQTIGQEVVIDKTQLWAQDLSDNVKRVLQQNMRKQLPSVSVYSYPLGANLRPDHIIDLQIIEMIANKENQTLRVVANWQVIEPNERNPQSHDFDKSYPLQNLSVNNIVSGYQQAVADLSVHIIPTI